MVQRTIYWGAILVGAYLVLTNFKGFTSDLNSAGSNGVNLVKAFQGRG